MYNEFYQFKKEPFNVTPDPDFFFMSSSHKEALAAIIYGVERRKGFIAIIGEVGLGKTTVLRSYLQQAKSDALKAVYIFNANVSFGGLLKNIYRELGLNVQAGQISELIDHLHQFLISEYKLGHNVALIVDEAQNMPTETLENLRMLSNLETAEEKLIQIVLIGQPELQERLQQKELRQLNQRIALRHTIAPLSREESLGYIRHRLERVVLSTEPVFNKSALSLISKHSQGIPRIINIVCDNALIAGFGSNKKPVTRKIVRQVIADLEGKSRWRWLRWRLTFALIVAVVLALLWMSPVRHEIASQLNQLSFATASFQGPAKYVVDNSKIIRPLKADLNRASNSGPNPQAETQATPISPQTSTGPPQVTANPGTEQHPRRDAESAGSQQQTSIEKISVEEPALAAPRTEHQQPAEQGDNVASRPSPEAKSIDLSKNEPLGDPPSARQSAKSAASPDALSADPGREGDQHSANGNQTSVDDRQNGKELASLTNPSSIRSNTDEPSPNPLPARVVKKGDNLTKLTQEAYGSVDADLLAWVRKNNPQITDIDRLLIGTRVVFPDLPNSAGRPGKFN